MHDVLVTHPEYQPFPRRVRLKPGEERVLEINLFQLGIKLKP